MPIAVKVEKQQKQDSVKNGCYYEKGLIFAIIILGSVLLFIWFFFSECDIDCVAWSDDSLFLAIGERFVSFKG